MIGIDAATWRERNDALVGHLHQIGVLNDPAWRQAFRDTPRHAFVPAFFADAGTLVSGVNASQRDEWLGAVYGDTSLVIQRAPAMGYDRPIATSSSTKPSLMARMLELLDIATARTRVLEIGTATGYNAALLCHRIGSHNLCTVELHPDIARMAKEHLGELGLYPDVLVGDGAQGHLAHAPYDRIIATCAVDKVPVAWIEQLRPGGRMVADLRSEMSSSLVVLIRSAADRVEGRLLERPGHFMWLRPNASSPLLHPSAPPLIVDHNVESASVTQATFDSTLLGEPGLRLMVGILEPTAVCPSTAAADSEESTHFLYSADGSWCELTTTPCSTRVVQGGPRRLWDSIELAAHEWRRLGRSGRGRFGLTVTVNGRHTYWIDDPSRTLFAEAD